MEMESLNLDNILSPDQIDNFFGEETTEGDKDKQKEEETTEDKVDAENLFSPESVGSEDKKDTGTAEDTSESKKENAGSSPNFYSSIASALKEDGIFPDLDDEVVSKISTPEDFAELFESQIASRLDTVQKRVNEALSIGVEPTEIQKYESTLKYLDSIKEESITDESENGEKLRKQLIYNDYLNRGYSKERANREVKKSFDGGTDIEDAKEALKSNKEFFEKSYDELISEAKREAEKAEAKTRKEAEDLKKSMLEDEKAFGGIKVDKTTRQKAFEAISKPVWKDPETGELYTAVQKYEMDNRLEFLKNVGLLYTLTDGFKNIDRLVKDKVNTEMKKGLRELEHTINNTSRTTDGNLRFMNDLGSDSESYIGKGMKLDL